MNCQKLLFIFIINIFLIGGVSAAQTSYGTITQIKAFGSQAYIYVVGVNDAYSCGSSDRVRLYWNNANADRFMSIILAAQMANKQVSFEGNCVSGLLAISAIYVKS